MFSLSLFFFLCFAPRRSDCSFFGESRILAQIVMPQSPQHSPTLSVCTTQNMTETMDDHDSDRDKNTPQYALLHAACAQRDMCGVGRVLRSHPGLDINKGNDLDQTPLILAIKTGCTAIVFQLFDQCGARIDVNAQDSLGKSALFYACEHNQDVLAMHLLARHADPNISDDFGTTPLMIACDRGFQTIAMRLFRDNRLLVNPADHEGTTALWYAARHGRDELVVALLQRKANPNAADMQQKTPLIAAAEHGHLACVQALLHCKTINLNLRDNMGRTAIQYACRHNFTHIFQALFLADGIFTAIRETSDHLTLLMTASDHGNMDMVHLLLGHKQHPFRLDINTTDTYGRTALYYACPHPEIVDTLIECGADPHHTDMGYTTVLMRAAELGALETTTRLLAHHVAVDHIDSEGFTALAYACIFGKDHVVALLLERGASPLIASNDDRTPLMVAAYHGHHEIVRLLLTHAPDTGIDYVDIRGETALAKACRRRAGPVATVEALLDHGASPWIADIKDVTPLMKACEDNRADIVGLLLQHHAENPHVINAYDIDDITAMHYACRAQATACVTLLLDHGACAVLDDDHGTTPLMLACENGNVDIAQALVREATLAGNDYIDDKDMRGKTALYFACASDNVPLVELLLRNGADAWIHCDSLITPLILAAKAANTHMIETLLSISATARHSINAGDIHEETPLFHAVATGHLDCVQLLLGYEADPLLKNDAGTTPLMEATEMGALDIVKELVLTPFGLASSRTVYVNMADDSFAAPLHRAAAWGHLDIVDFLLENHADITLIDEDGDTPLHFASRHKRSDVVERFLHYCTPEQVNSLNADGKTPLFYAISYHNLRMVDLFRKHGADIQPLCANQTIWDTGYPHHVNLRMIQTLVDDYGIDVNMKNPQGKTPLYLLANSLGNKRDAIQFVLNRGANPWIPAPNGRLPIAAAKSPAIIALIENKMQEHERYQWIEKAREIQYLYHHFCTHKASDSTKRAKCVPTRTPEVFQNRIETSQFPAILVQPNTPDTLHGVLSHVIGDHMNNDIFGELLDMMKVPWEVPS